MIGWGLMYQANIPVSGLPCLLFAPPATRNGHLPPILDTQYSILSLPLAFPRNTFKLLNMSKPRPLDPKVLRHCAGALRTLSHPDRLRIVEALENGPLDVSELTTRLRRPQATVSQHLMRLRAHGLVAAERSGRVARYRVAHAGCLSILGCIRSQFSQ
ncbi:MAG: winged helix-turn-helix transcriptional regulator [Verrucomicrobia bacterium]|nr:winged helix-turn-helix transcriptional regulator [Verrucomicrobiota bacterium]